MECKTCGKENDSSAKFCGVCGTQLIEDSIDFDPQSIGSENPMIGFGAAIQLGFKKIEVLNLEGLRMLASSGFFTE